MKKTLAVIAIITSLGFCSGLGHVNAQTGTSSPSQNDILQQYLQSKQQQQTQQTQAQQQSSQQSQSNSSSSKTSLSIFEILLLVIYSITLLLAWTNLVLGIVALTRWLKQRKAQLETNKNMIR